MEVLYGLYSVTRKEDEGTDIRICKVLYRNGITLQFNIHATTLHDLYFMSHCMKDIIYLELKLKKVLLEAICIIVYSVQYKMDIDDLYSGVMGKKEMKRTEKKHSNYVSNSVEHC